MDHNVSDFHVYEFAKVMLDLAPLFEEPCIEKHSSEHILIRQAMLLLLYLPNANNVEKISASQAIKKGVQVLYAGMDVRPRQIQHDCARLF